jgi:hypothetical protein
MQIKEYAQEERKNERTDETAEGKEDRKKIHEE